MFWFEGNRYKEKALIKDKRDIRKQPLQHSLIINIQFRKGMKDLTFNTYSKLVSEC